MLAEDQKRSGKNTATICECNLSWQCFFRNLKPRSAADIVKVFEHLDLVGGRPARGQIHGFLLPHNTPDQRWSGVGRGGWVVGWVGGWVVHGWRGKGGRGEGKIQVENQEHWFCIRREIPTIVDRIARYVTSCNLRFLNWVCAVTLPVIPAQASS